MSQLTDSQVDLIANRVASLLNPSQPLGQIQAPPVPDLGQTGSERYGVFGSVDSAVKATRKAFEALNVLTLEQRSVIIASIRAKMRIHADDLAKKACDETQMGRYEDKVLKNQLVTEKTEGPEALTPKALSGDRGLTLTEWAPYGVIGSITPSTNPTSTIICNTIGMLAAGNGVVFNVHPMAKEVSILNVELLNEAIMEAGGPPNLVTTVASPTIQSANELMQHKEVDLLVVTGGEAVVKAAMASGKRAICAGPGNPPVVVDETANIEQAARDIVRGAGMDNGIICVLEKEVFVVESVADQLLAAFTRHGAVVLKPHEVNQLEKVLFEKTNGMRKPGVMNKEMIGKNIQDILSKIGMQVADDIRIAIAPVSVGHPLIWTEQLLPVLPVARVLNVNQAIDLAKEAEHNFRHTAVIHSKDLDNLSRMARVMGCSIFVKNGPSLAGLGYGGEGFASFSIASPTGDGMTGPHSFVRPIRCVLVDNFRIV
ncbi:aldehyde dehydrogenase EutE [bacterium]|nr:aldehyde dehydrogenase EutE [bacterium]